MTPRQPLSQRQTFRLAILAPAALLAAVTGGCEPPGGGGPGIALSDTPGLAQVDGDSGDPGDGSAAGDGVLVDGAWRSGDDGGATDAADGGPAPDATLPLADGADGDAGAGATDAGGPGDTMEDASLDDAGGDATGADAWGSTDASGGTSDAAADAASPGDAGDSPDGGGGPLPCQTDSDCAGAQTAPCTISKCKATTHVCVAVDAPDGAICDDGDACTEGTTCTFGVCAGGSVVTCAPPDACTKSSCDAVLGCVVLVVDGPCDDGDTCTVGDVCTAGGCGGTPLACSDGDPCTADSCTGGACVHKPTVGPCDDGDPCTANDACAAGLCVPGTPVVCPAPGGCGTSWCVPTVGCVTVSGCSLGQICDAAEQQCVPACAATCGGKQCGPDGCGASCGTCDPGLQCFGGQCKAACTGACGEMACGDDGCGGSCGTCPAGSTCTAGACTAGCVPSCGGKECGDDGCGGACGSCPDGIECTVGGHCGSVCTTCDPAPGCSDLSFEAGNLVGWSASGAQVVEKLGPSLPTEGAYMVELPTGAGPQTLNSSEASVQLCLSAGVHSISFDWKFLSEEFIEWCGSAYEDRFSVELTHATGAISLLDETITSLCPESSCLGCGGGYVGLTPSEVTLDQGDVWETPWMTRSATFELKEDQVVTLRFSASDAGDSIYDSVALVDAIHVDACIPSCSGMTCGGDGCGGSCGVCGVGMACVAGTCAPAGCGDGSPQAVLVIPEGLEVIPQTVLHLNGDQSYAAGGPIAKWAWTVVQPVGSQSVFVPSAAFPNPIFEVSVAGTYLFTLTVWDDSGTPSCIPEEAEVVVIPDEAIHVELLWNTPNDPDQTDEGPEAGADVDLHFLHPFASGPDLDGDGEPDGWFDQPFDCFWTNPHPNWGSFDPTVDDDPGLDRDDADGAGPENLNLNIPEGDKTYAIGVHYRDDHTYGPSYVTLRVYIYAVLVFELSDVKLLAHDMWEVATIQWPSGAVTLVTSGDGNYKTTPNYTDLLTSLP